MCAMSLRETKRYLCVRIAWSPRERTCVRYIRLFSIPLTGHSLDLSPSPRSEGTTRAIGRRGYSHRPDPPRVHGRPIPFRHRMLLYHVIHTAYYLLFVHSFPLRSVTPTEMCLSFSFSNQRVLPSLSLSHSPRTRESNVRRGNVRTSSQPDLRRARHSREIPTQLSGVGEGTTRGRRKRGCGFLRRLPSLTYIRRRRDLYRRLNDHRRSS